jgi:DNA mismatch repair protein MutS
VGFIFESLFIGLTLATFISSLWNQIQSALHLRAIWDNVKIQGRAVQGLVASCASILKHLKSLDMKYQRALRTLIDTGEELCEKTKFLESADELTAYGSVWNDDAVVQELMGWIGAIDALCGVASLSGICIPKLQAGGGAELSIEGIHHPELQTSCVRNSFTADAETRHAIITGPNRGGKTTFCRALGLAVVTAQSWGFAWARRMRWTPFSTMWTALETNGVLGSMSKFESEIEFAKSVLETQGPCFVMMDEIFHSTNATDGVAASTVFLKQLYARQDVVSIISTHYKELATLFGPSSAAVYQMVAQETAGGKLEYTYRLAPGISETSSVMEILAERGLLKPAVDAAVKASN